MYTREAVNEGETIRLRWIFIQQTVKSEKMVQNPAVINRKKKNEKKK